MAAKFTHGDSIHTTRSTAQQGKVREPHTSSHALKGGSTMPGMPGHICAGQTAAEGGAKGGHGVGPKREGPIGRKGGSGAKSMGKAAPGTTTKSYHAASTGHPGRIEKLKARTSFEGGRRKSTMY